MNSVERLDVHPRIITALRKGSLFFFHSTHLMVAKFSSQLQRVGTSTSRKWTKYQTRGILFQKCRKYHSAGIYCFKDGWQK